MDTFARYLAVRGVFTLIKEGRRGGGRRGGRDERGGGEEEEKEETKNVDRL